MQEVLISMSPIQGKSLQLSLFARPHYNPHWTDLSFDVQQKILRLLTQLLRQHQNRATATGMAEEATDE